jgi:osmotically inducible protein OsmC
MPARTAEAQWSGNVLEGKGRVKLGSGTFEGPYDFRSRIGDGQGTNPEELIGAAHAGCFSMALSSNLTQAGFVPDRIHTTAKVHLEKRGDAFVIPRIELDTEAVVPGLEQAAFQKHALDAKSNCPVSKALAGVEISLTARLLNTRAA